MVINIRGEKIKVTDSIRNYVEQKLARLDRYFGKENELVANVLIKIKGNSQSVEVTVPTPKFVLRREEKDEDLYAAIDLVIDKLERQIRKNKTKIERRYKEDFVDFSQVIEIDKKEENNSKIVKRKNIISKPMDEEEAILELELLGHDFFVFKNSEEECVSVLYKRKDSDYGLINIK